MNYYAAIFSCFLLSCLFSNAQMLDKTANERLVIQHELTASKQLKENIYIHTDKDIYEPGEDLWFKAYILNANDLNISLQTNMIFVELRKQGEEDVITKEIYTSSTGFASGHLFLADILKDGTYHLVVHTKNTVESASETILASKQIEIRESIIPKILIDSEFHKKSYDRTEEVHLEVAIFSRSRVPYAEASIIAEIFSTDKKIGRIKAKTNAQGEAKLIFPVKKTANAEYIQLRVRYKDETVTYNVEIPFQNPAAIQFGLFPEGGNLIENLPNTVAFKAVDHHGKPLNVEGALYEDGKKVRSIKATHFGMGKFSFVPKSEKKYTVQLSNPVLDSIFELPNIRNSGIKLQVNRSNQKHILFDITKTKDVSLKNVYIRAQNRGTIYWMATASLTKDRIRFKIPLEKLPQGITEVTIFNERFQPLAERLVYANLDQKLQVTLEEISKSNYRQKDKVNMRFSVKDKFGNPAVGHFSLSVFDHLYANKDNHYSMLPHYYLFSELKGHVYNASYYFDEKNKNREEKLDLLLLTQGWRAYNWNPQYFSKNPVATFSTDIKGQVFEKSENRTLKNAKNVQINVMLSDILTQIEGDLGGNFVLPVTFLRLGRGEKIIVSPQDSEKYTLEVYLPFDELLKRSKDKTLLFPQSDYQVGEKRQSSYDPSFSFNETNYLEEVKLTTYKKRKKNRGSKSNFYAGFVSGDYVCYEYEILNCTNHPAGTRPIDGKYYLRNDGTRVRYVAPYKAKDDIEQNFLLVKGMYPEKEFYNPSYDKAEDKLFPDNRKTLFWSPNLVSDRNGEINVTFFTSDVQTTFLGELQGTNGNGLLGATSFQFNVD
ncbi:MG2 domain-containing protein [Kordia jejudonensis]|uniref:MG2 domain-containing protein n=1 Tax=Kordia jejudonensis TaxID=1348245 RepID=UPI0006290D19|nr:MG2 domain-containing protein [Kordia jejudonensis]